MAASITSAWAKPGAWALESEESEAMEILDKTQGHVSAADEPSDFPSLAAAAATKASKKKKKLSLAEFTTGHAVTHGAAKARPSAPDSKGLTADELLALPTGPRERTAEELERGSSYRGFNYSSHGGGSREESGASRWGSARGSDEARRSRGDADGFSRESAPSRADEIDDWGAMKKSAAPLAERRERGGGFFDSQSRADGSDSWIMNKGSTPAPALTGRRGVDGFRERRGGFEFDREGTNGVEGDSWGKKREEPNVAGRPKLVLQPKTVLVDNGNVGEQVPAPKSKSVNPFGAARPREEVLAEKGQDWKKIDEKLESMKIREVRPLSREGPGFGRRSSGSGVASEERKWRKDDSAITPPPASSEQAEPDVSSN